MTGPSKTILLLEDEPLILMDLEYAAEDVGLRSLTASDVKSALQLLASDPPDCAILDVSLKAGETCLPVAEELDRQGIPYIIHSGDLDRQDERIRSLNAPRAAKPCPSDKVVRMALDHAGLSDLV